MALGWCSESEYQKFVIFKLNHEEFFSKAVFAFMGLLIGHVSVTFSEQVKA